MTFPCAWLAVGMVPRPKETLGGLFGQSLRKDEVFRNNVSKLFLHKHALYSAPGKHDFYFMAFDTSANTFIRIICKKIAVPIVPQVDVMVRPSVSVYVRYDVADYRPNKTM